jgi:hypothetical protein
MFFFCLGCISPGLYHFENQGGAKSALSHTVQDSSTAAHQRSSYQGLASAKPQTVPESLRKTKPTAKARETRSPDRAEFGQ